MAFQVSNHPIEVVSNSNRVRVIWRGEVIADTTRSMSLQEGSYPVVHYIPREDVATALLSRTTLQTRCPYKGQASYYSIMVREQTAENAVWTYEAPYAAAASPRVPRSGFAVG